MSDQPQTPTGPDLAVGTPADSISDGVPLLGHVGTDPVILVRRGVETYRPLPLAPCLLQPPDRCGSARAGPDPTRHKQRLVN